MSPDIAIGLVAVVIIGTGLVSIAGALRRTSKRPTGNNLRGDGGPIIGGPTSRDDSGDGDGGGD